MKSTFPKQRPTVAVFFGGRSPEHDVSVSIASDVIRAIDQKKYQVKAIEIAQDGCWYIHDMSKVMYTKHQLGPASRQAPMGEITNCFSETSCLCDVAFPILLGEHGEDGAIQGFLETIGIRWIGAGILGSAVGMDKIVAKQIAQSCGIEVVPYLSISVREWKVSPTAVLANILDNIGVPFFVKPAAGGSSLGIVKVEEASQGATALQEVFQKNTRVLVEVALPIREIEVAVLERGEALIVSPPGELVLNQTGFFSYEAKYQQKDAFELVFPTASGGVSHAALETMTRKLYDALACQGYGRFDYFLTPDGKLLFNEVNTMPVIWQDSAYVQLMNKKGVSYSALLDCLIGQSF